MGAGELNFALWKMLRLGTTGKADEGKAGSRKCGSMSEYNMNRQDPKTRKTGNKIRMCRKIRTCRRKISKKISNRKISKNKSATKSEPATPGEKTEQQLTAKTPKTRKTENKIRMRRKIRTCRRKISKKNQQQKKSRRKISNEIGTGNTRREDRAARTHKGKFNNRHQTSSVVHTQPETGCYRAALVELPESPRVPAETGLTHLISML